MKKHEMIYADPPWRYRNGEVQGAAINHYVTVSDEELYQLPVVETAADNCVLLLWATLPELPEALRLIEAQGSQRKTVGLVWVKTNLSGNGFFLDPDWQTRSGAEIRLPAVRGKPKRQRADISQLIISPRERHSKKSDIVRNLAVILVDDVPRAKLFVREMFTGWDVWRNGVDCNITLTQSEGDAYE